MTTGYSSPIGEFQDWRDHLENEVIGIVVAKSFPEPQTIIDNVKRGVAAYPDAVWVVRGKPKSDDASRHVVSALADEGQQAVFAEGNPFWLSNGRAAVRDEEMMNLCTQVLVFHEPNSPTTSDFIKLAFTEDRKRRIHVIERGKKKRKRPARRKPE